jgi:hypothetical protein
VGKGEDSRQSGASLSRLMRAWAGDVVFVFVFSRIVALHRAAVLAGHTVACD